MNSRVRYRSTRGGVTGKSFTEAVLCGLAEDGGLLVPETVPVVADVSVLRGLSYCDLCYEVLRLYVHEEDIPSGDLRELIHQAYKPFSCDECVKYSSLQVRAHQIIMMELYHGPTLAFKDFALQFLGQLMGWILEKRNETITILGATSGDTGSAAIRAFQDVPNVRCCILYPDGKTSKLQELQMITAAADNVQCLALDGACFDDCQALVKSLFESPLKAKLKLSAVNSINWARILAQTVYYWHCSLRENQDIDVVVPTGNFGNALAAHYAKLSGAPIRRVIIAANSNDCLPRFLSSGEYAARPVIPTMSPSMDIQLSSNFERAIFLCGGGDAEFIRELFVNQLCDAKKFVVDDVRRAKIADAFWSFSASEEETAESIREAYKMNVLLDPHTAVGVHCTGVYMDGRDKTDNTPVVVAATAHCGKFPESIARVVSPTVAEAAIPDTLKSLRGLPTKYKKMAPTYEAVSSFLEGFAT